jgi:hypothetical protein
VDERVLAPARGEPERGADAIGVGLVLRQAIAERLRVYERLRQADQLPRAERGAKPRRPHVMGDLMHARAFRHARRRVLDGRLRRQADERDPGRLSGHVLAERRARGLRRVANAPRLADARRVHADATTARAAFGFETAGTSAKIRLRVLEAEAVLEEATLRIQECERIHAVARAQWARRLTTAWEARSAARLRAVLADAHALHARLLEDRDDRAAMQTALGFPQGGEHPEVHATNLVHALERRLRELDPPPVVRPPIPPGKVYVRAKARFIDSAGTQHYADDRAVDLLPVDDLEKVVKEGWAERVER